MKYYHYISKSKVDALFSQIPQKFLDGLKVEIGFDFGLLKGKLEGESRDMKSLVACVQAIEKFLKKDKQILNNFGEGTWAQGVFLARSGILPMCPGLVLFGGRINDIELLLAGSESNLISGSFNPGKDQGWSWMPRTLEYLKQHIESEYSLRYNPSMIKLLSDQGLDPKARIFNHSFGKDFDGGQFDVFYSLAEESLPEPDVKLSFLARIFASAQNEKGDRLAVGTPLYIAD